MRETPETFGNRSADPSPRAYPISSFLGKTPPAPLSSRCNRNLGLFFDANWGKERSYANRNHPHLSSPRRRPGHDGDRPVGAVARKPSRAEPLRRPSRLLGRKRSDHHVRRQERALEV